MPRFLSFFVVCVIVTTTIALIMNNKPVPNQPDSELVHSSSFKVRKITIEGKNFLVFQNGSGIFAIENTTKSSDVGL
jgi:hypothetical protein